MTDYALIITCRPDYVLHMETLEEDLALLLDRVGLNEHRELFPHTHIQQGGPSSNMTSQLLQQLRPDELQALVNKYRLDFDLYGYDTIR